MAAQGPVFNSNDLIGPVLIKTARIPATGHIHAIAVPRNDVFGDCAGRMRNQSDLERRARRHRGTAAAEASGRIEV